MESKANYALVGVFVLAALAAVLSFVLWFSNAQFDQQFDEYEVVFQGAVRGLSQGSDVRFNGLSVGQVTSLRLDADASNTVIADIQVQAGIPIRLDSSAQLEPQGLTGLNYIQISAGSEDLGLLSELSDADRFTIQGRMSQIDNLVEGGEDVILGAQRALTRFNALLSEEAILDFQGILQNTRQITSNLKDTDIDSGLVNDVLESFETAANNVSSAAIATEKAAAEFDLLVSGDVKSTLARAEISMAELDKTLIEFRTVGVNADGAVTDVRDAVNRVSNSGLRDIEETLDGIRASVDSLQTILKELEQSPITFISGEDVQTMEIPQ